MNDQTEINPIRVEIGTHFAVMEYDDGTVEMYWDDDKLLEEIRAALTK